MSYLICGGGDATTPKPPRPNHHPDAQRPSRTLVNASTHTSLHLVTVFVNVEPSAIEIHMGQAFAEIPGIIISCGDDQGAALVNIAPFAIDVHPGQAFAEIPGIIIFSGDNNAAVVFVAVCAVSKLFTTASCATALIALTTAITRITIIFFIARSEKVALHIKIYSRVAQSSSLPSLSM